MDTSNPDEPLAPAEVIANRYRVRYHRRGSGSPVILVRPPELATTLAAALDNLAARFRVLVPLAVDRSPDAGGEDAEPVCASAHTAVEMLEWLGCFVEGLGIVGADVVAAGRYRAAAVELAAALPDLVDRVVLLRLPGDRLHEPRASTNADASPRVSPSQSRVLEIAYDAGQPLVGLRRIVSFLEGRGRSRPA